MNDWGGERLAFKVLALLLLNQIKVDGTQHISGHSESRQGQCVLTPEEEMTKLNHISKCSAYVGHLLFSNKNNVHTQNM